MPDADEGQVGQVLNNLLINADLSMPGGGVVVALYKAELERGIRPAAVIMDLTNPGKMGGLEAAAILLSTDPSARIMVSS